jgi:thiol-disulfide isomerase/thioredoxin
MQILTLVLSFLLLVPGGKSSGDVSTRAAFKAEVHAGLADSLKEGDAAPMFVLRDIKTDDGVYLRDYTGKELRRASKNKERKVVVLSFWATWCQPCKEEIPRVTKLAAALKEKPIQFFLVNTMEDRSITDDSIRTFYRTRGYTLPCLLDMTGRVGMRYNARVLPLLVVIDKQGVIRKIMRGFHEDSYSDLEGFLQRLAQ